MSKETDSLRLEEFLQHRFELIVNTIAIRFEWHLMSFLMWTLVPPHLRESCVYNTYIAAIHLDPQREFCSDVGQCSGPSGFSS